MSKEEEEQEEERDNDDKALRTVLRRHTMPKSPRRRVWCNNLRARLNRPPLPIVPNHNNFPNIDNLRARRNNPPHNNGPAYMASLKEFRWRREQDKTLKEYHGLISEGYRIDHDGGVAGSIPQNQVQQQQPLLMDTTVDDRIDQLMAGMFSKVLIAPPRIPPTAPPPKVPVPVANEADVHTNTADEASDINEMEVDPITPDANAVAVAVAVAALVEAVVAVAVADTSTADADSCIAEMEVDPSIPTTATLHNVDVAVAAVGVAVAHEADAAADTSTAVEDNPSTVQRFKKVEFANPIGTFEDVSNLVLNENNIYRK